MADPTAGAEDVRGALYECFRSGKSLESRVDRALEIVKKHLVVENAHLTRIDPTTGYWEAIASTDPAQGDFPVGLSVELGETYCRRTLDAGETLAIRHAREEGWETDPAYRTHGLECYMGTPLEVGEMVYGTLCFVSEEKRKDAFTQKEESVAELAARLIGQAFERSRQERRLEEREQMIEVLSRILRHNLRTEMTIIRGHTEGIADQLEHPDIVDPILSSIDDLLGITEKARQISDLVNEDRNRTDVELVPLCRRLTERYEETDPNAEIVIDGPPEAQVRATVDLERAIAELLENAVLHGGESPQVTVRIDQAAGETRISVTDDGPGLNEQDRAVLESGEESPLQHGSGLGLWVVNWIVGQNGGRVDTSVGANGTTVVVHIPNGHHNPLTGAARAENGEVSG